MTELVRLMENDFTFYCITLSSYSQRSTEETAGLLRAMNGSWVLSFSVIVLFKLKS